MYLLHDSDPASQQKFCVVFQLKTHSFQHGCRALILTSPSAQVSFIVLLIVRVLSYLLTDMNVGCRSQPGGGIVQINGSLFKIDLILP